MATEKRLIDANRILRDPYFQEGRYPESHLLRMAIREQPTVDAVEVVHGRWIVGDPDCAEADLTCGECGYEYDFEPGGGDLIEMLKHDYKFCPHCGAKMDGDGNG